MKTLFILTTLIFALSAGSAVLAQNAPETKDGFLLPELEKIAHEDGDKIFTICEIYNGESRVAVIRPNIRCHNTYSIAKLFTVATLGIMEDKGLLDIDEPVYPILKDKFPENFDPKWRDVKISDVIRHRTGFGVAGMLDIDATNSSTWPRDFLNILLSSELKYKPGEKYVYTDATFYLASRIASEKSGEKLNEFMIRELLDPLEFEEYAFSTDPEGYPIGATGMYISTEDMAKLGLLFVQDGVYKGKQIISKRFVDEAFDRTFELYPIGDEGVAFTKGGMNGQTLYMNRKTKRVVAVHSYLGDVDAILKFLIENDK
ncbi:MAG: serine hydrolase [Thermoguttaceae bacterium]|nr:serine hydrolase [Thermoguttaceae bacterium]